MMHNTIFATRHTSVDAVVNIPSFGSDLCHLMPPVYSILFELIADCHYRPKRRSVVSSSSVPRSM